MEETSSKYKALVGLMIAFALSGQASFGASAISCETLFSPRASKTVGAKDEKASEPDLPPAETESINSNVSGSEIYRAVIGKIGQKSKEGNAVGIFGRVGRTWKQLIEGEVFLLPDGLPFLRQLQIAKQENRGQILTVVNGQMYLFTNQSSFGNPKTYVQFGSKQTPLIEVGTGQERFLQPISAKTKISVAEFSGGTALVNGTTSVKADAVLVSIKFEKPELVGTGMTFAFLVRPTSNPTDAVLVGKPMVIDYEFRSPTDLRLMVDTEANNYIAQSAILFRQFATSDLSDFKNQAQAVRKLVEKHVETNAKPGAASGLSETVHYNLTTGRTNRKLLLEHSVFNDSTLEVKQDYFSDATPKLVFDGAFAAETKGLLDVLPNGKPALWRSTDSSGASIRSTVFVKDGVWFSSLALGTNYREPVHIVELGVADVLFPFAKSAFRQGADYPKSVDVLTITPEGKNSGYAFVLLSVQSAKGEKFTSVVRLNVFMNSLIQVDSAFRLTEFAMSADEMKARTDLNTGGDAVFDGMTPAVKSLAAYEQAYDPSRPHLNLKLSSPAGFQYLYKRPHNTVRFADGLTFASFSLTKGIPDPTGLYTGVAAEKITGNERERFVGELIVNPSVKKDLSEADEYKRYVFAEVNAPKHQDEKGESYGSQDVSAKEKMYLFATDANRKQGAAGYGLLLAVPNAKGEYKLEPLRLHRALLSNIQNLKEAIFVRGRKSHSKFYYLLLSFKIPSGTGPQTVEMTQAIKIQMLPDAHDMKAFTVDERAYSSADVGRRLGFTEAGTPALILTNDMAADAHQFALFDLSTGSKVFPNQFSGDGPNRFKEIKFGGLSGSVSSYQNFVSAEDSWSILPSDAGSRYPGLGRSRELAKFDSFVELGKSLDAMASLREPPQRMLLVVPSALRDLVWDFILNKIASSPVSKEQALDRFAGANRNLTFHLISKSRSSQNQYLANLDYFSKSRRVDVNDRHFLVARTDEIGLWDSERSGEDAPFKIREVGPAETNDLSPISTSRSDRKPHPLYLLAAGRALSPKEFRAQKPDADASMLILTTPEELRAIRETANVEVESGMLDAYKIQEIRDPDHESMSHSLTHIFAHPDVKSLGYEFSASAIKQGVQLDSEQSFQVLLDYAISRFSYYVTEKKEPLFESFMRFRAAFANSVLSDREARRSHVLDKYFVERVLTQVFDIPMNLATLPADDPMRILSANDALLRWHKAGYKGSFELKAMIRDTIISQTRADAGKPIPGSIMVFGKTGAGKTFAFQTLVKMLKLKPYVVGAKDNNDAQYIVFTGSKILEKGGQDREGSVDVDQVIEHLEKFLDSPNGYRGWILLDDLHAAPDPVKAKLINWLRSLQESENGMYLTRSGVRRPIRNLNIWMTLNPTADLDQISKYAKSKTEPTLEEILLATLSSAESKIEPSFLRRWGRIVNLDFMPPGAKGPELIDRVSQSSNSLLNTHNRITLVDPQVVDLLVHRNGQVDARTFLTASTNSLIEMAAQSEQKGSLVMVVLNRRYNLPSPQDRSNTPGELRDPGEQISKWVRDNTRTLVLDSGLEGRLSFLKMIVDAYRIPIYEGLVLFLQQHEKIAIDRTNQKVFLAPMLLAISHHIADHGRISVRDLGVSASDYGFNSVGDRSLFRDTVDRISDPRERPIVPPIFRQLEAGQSWDNMFAGDSASAATSPRAAVFTELFAEQKKALYEHLATVLQVRDLSIFPESSSWAAGLVPPKGESVSQISEKLGSLLWDYLPRVMEAEGPAGQQSQQVSIYAATRLYLIAMDFALTQLPWVESSHFLLRSLDAITQDQVLSQKPGVQTFLFKDPQRLIKPTILDFLYQTIENSQITRELSPEAKQRLKDDFAKDCESYLTPVSKK